MKTLYQKIWERHQVVPETEDTPAVLYIDLHLLHEVTTPQAFDLLRQKGLPVRRVDKCLATLDHSTPTVPVTTLKDLEVVSEPSAAKQVRQMEKNCKDFGIELRGYQTPRLKPQRRCGKPGRILEVPALSLKVVRSEVHTLRPDHP